jgi:uncharacterized protein YecT (DUF1311 family)
MIKPHLLTLVIIFYLVLFAACRQVQETASDAEQLSTPNSPLTNPTKNEIEAAKTACDEAINTEEAEQCVKNEFEKADAELKQVYQRILTNLQSYAEKAVSQDKVLADKYKKDHENLQTAQKAWLAFREANCTAEKTIPVENQNANYIGFSCQGRMTEDRIEDLKLIYENK